MPKANPVQTTFSGGEFSPLIQGRVDSERYKTGLDICLNYIPTLQGPLVRRPGSKYIANAKDPSKPPTLVPFQFSTTQTYALEFGDRYVRFFANEGEIITSSNQFKFTAFVGFPGKSTISTFTCVRDTYTVRPGEGTIISSSFVAAGSLLELQTPYAYTDAQNLKYAQNGDTLFITHPLYPPMKLQRFGQTSWDLKPVLFQDGPYLALNSYKKFADSTRITLTPTTTGIGFLDTGPAFSVYGAANNGAGLVRITTSASHGYQSGDKVYIAPSASLPAYMTNGTSSIANSFWTITAIGATTFDLNCVFSTGATGSTGTVAPALFELNQSSPTVWSDSGAVTTGSTIIHPRNIGLINAGIRYSGNIFSVSSPSRASITMFDTLPNTSAVVGWFTGVYSGGNGFPNATCFHQDRLALAGTTNFPQEVDLSTTSIYENFSPSSSSQQVVATNALSLNLLSADSNAVQWIKSSNQGLLAGSVSNEWQIAPSTTGQALAPTNVNASPTSYYGSANVDAVQAGNATLYVQKAFRKVREMNYFFQVGTFRSTDLAELSEHITAPRVIKMAVQKEPLPLVWAVRSDGVLLSMSYNRDDQTIKAGWARHILGGRSDSAGTAPQVKSIAVITSSNAATDQLWMTVNRYVNGSSTTTIEILTTPWNASLPQEDGYCLDNGITYDAPIAITNIPIQTSAVNIASFGHGMVDGDTVQITDVVGLNSSTTDSLGNTTIVNLLNEQIFTVGSSFALGFQLQDANGNQIVNGTSSVYVSGGVFRKRVTHISGLTWLKTETVGIVADGGIQSDVVVDSSGLITLSSPAAKVQIGYRYNSDGSTLRTEAGGAAGSSIGMHRRIVRAAFLLYKCGDFAFGPTFASLIPIDFPQADLALADTATSLFSGLYRDGVESIYDLDDNLSFRQNSGLPGMVQSLTVMMEEVDV